MGQGPIRIIFPLFVLAMWAMVAVWAGNDAWTTTNWLSAAIAAASCLLVFRNFVWVFSYSYALSVGLINALILVREGVSLGSALISGLLVAYGLRLFLFVLGRYRSAGYAPRRAFLDQAHRELPFPVKLILFVSVTTLMTFHSLAAYLVAREQADGPLVLLAAAVIALGLLIEAAADRQKQRAKALHPDLPITTGLFARVRHPNYAGEIVVQAGLVAAGLAAATAWYESVGAILAPVYIVLLMLTQAAAGDRTQTAKYAADPAYRNYRAGSGSLIPGRSVAQ
jgi:steroid 5-alpha reductase family enzyme